MKATISQESVRALSKQRPYLSILHEVANATGFRVAELRGPSRKRDVVFARWIFMHEAQIAGASLNQIGAELGGRDHTTVMHGLKQIREIMAQ